MVGFQHKRTTAYHPQCNGLVERLHRQLKAAIVCHENQSWTEALPLVLLGLRSALKDDIHASPAELVYGETIRLPGDFFHESAPETIDLTDFITRLRKVMYEIKPVPATRHCDKKVFIHKDLTTASHVFLRDDTVRGALKPAYSGPHEVLERKGKIYKIIVKGKEQTVSVDRLKPAYVLNTPESPPETVEPMKRAEKVPEKEKEKEESNGRYKDNTNTTYRTRSGRQVRFPNYYRPS